MAQAEPAGRLEKMDEGLIVLIDERIDFADDAALALLGVKRLNDVKGKPYADIVLARFMEPSSSVARSDDQAEEGETQCWRTADGAAVTVLIRLVPAASRHGRKVMLVSASADRTLPGERNRGVEHARLRERLGLAIREGHFSLHYQPKADVRTGRISGVEALLRWQDPILGNISPSVFIPFAEEHGLIINIGRYVLHAACLQSQRWRNDGLGDYPVAVNLSARQFLDPELVSYVRSTLETTGLPPELLEFELTESASMANAEQSISVMMSLKELGISISIDDFGTGFSNLSYLKRFPVDKLKIDRSFMIEMTQSSESLSIVQAVIAMAHRLKLKVVAEGVETQKQLSFLALNYCDEVQGYFFSRPLPPGEFEMFVRESSVLKSDKNLDLAQAILFGCR